MTPAEIVAESRDFLNHTSTVVLTEDKMTRAFNAALERWAKDTLAYSLVTTMDVRAGQQDYDRSVFPDLYELERLTIKDVDGGPERPLLFIPPDELPIRYRDTSISGPPVGYSFRGDNILLLWPIPRTTLLSGLTLYATLLPPQFAAVSTNTDTLPFPRTHREGLVMGLCMRLCQLNLEDHTLAARLPLCLDAYTTEMQEAQAHAGQPDTTLIVGRRTRRPARFSTAPFDATTGERYTVRG